MKVPQLSNTVSWPGICLPCCGNWLHLGGQDYGQSGGEERRGALPSTVHVTLRPPCVHSEHICLPTSLKCLTSGVQNSKPEVETKQGVVRPRCPRTGCSAGKSLRGSLRCWPRQGGCTTPSSMTLIWSRPLAQVRKFSKG